LHLPYKSKNPFRPVRNKESNPRYGYKELELVSGSIEETLPEIAVHEIPASSSSATTTAEVPTASTASATDTSTESPSVSTAVAGEASTSSPTIEKNQPKGKKQKRTPRYKKVKKNQGSGAYVVSAKNTRRQGLNSGQPKNPSAPPKKLNDDSKALNALKKMFGIRTQTIGTINQRVKIGINEICDGITMKESGKEQSKEEQLDVDSIYSTEFQMIEPREPPNPLLSFPATNIYPMSDPPPIVPVLWDPKTGSSRTLNSKPMIQVPRPVAEVKKVATIHITQENRTIIRELLRWRLETAVSEINKVKKDTLKLVGEWVMEEMIKREAVKRTDVEQDRPAIPAGILVDFCFL